MAVAATVSAIRPSLRDHRQLSGSPHTPSRFISSNFSSPGSTFRPEEDAVILELDGRFLKAGYEGESGPQCVLPFEPDVARRVGDYRVWLPDYKRPHKDFARDAEEHELWRNDLKDFDLGLLEDKLERVVREAYNKYLLADAGNARLVLVLPSLVPLPVLASILTTLFQRWNYTSITMLPAPTMCAIAAGVRSALVVDIGWEETIVTPIYELRELPPKRSTRGMKRLASNMTEQLRSMAQKHSSEEGEPLRLDLDFVEDLISRLAFCPNVHETQDETEQRTETVSLDASQPKRPVPAVSIEWPAASSTTTVQVDTAELSATVESSFFGDSTDAHTDDQELALGQLVYHALLQLLPDVRGVCMSRIVFCGPGGLLPGLKSRILDEIHIILRGYGWNAVRGKNAKTPRVGLAELAQARTAPTDAKFDVMQATEKNFVEEKLLKHKAKEPQPGLQGVLRSIDTLGSWAGASLLTSLKIKGTVEIERERFLSQGLAGASREQDVVAAAQRANAAGVAASRTSESSSWTLAGWG